MWGYFMGARQNTQLGTNVYLKIINNGPILNPAVLVINNFGPINSKSYTNC